MIPVSLGETINWLSDVYAGRVHQDIQAPIVIGGRIASAKTEPADA